MRAVLAPAHQFDPRDPEALSMWNTAIEAVMFAKMIAAMAHVLRRPSAW